MNDVTYRASARLWSTKFDNIQCILCHETSGLAAPELQNLTPHDIGIIDAVIERAGPSATTFFTVFKAYSEVLKEHGLDPQEVVYYGKLLKARNAERKELGREVGFG
jgi:protein SFI1